ncbi:senescence-associated carboxylesterase 101-like [Rhodamnia argentea]|uniref:Senescence-associated carboxylesterase 101-like n=1 Tax=Rhodamnia argentea TaxID=178133 RepID=A0ABM3GUG4_9MYRT|nr:senescence-associated carboxylesterase 101-like [Rhodamnia argentea]XP_048127994.1 senescence-associated carboxylesterase 101-like [Rhodamnia argentea]
MGNLWSKRPLAPDCFNSPNPKKRKSTIFDSPVPQQHQPDNEAPPTMDYEEAAKTLFSNGLDLANFAVSSDILSNSWAAISELQSQIGGNHRSPPSSDTVKIREFEHPEYKIIAFVTPPVAPSYLQEQSGLVPSSSSEASEFKFLCSKKNPSFSINKAAISLFNSLKDQLSPLKAQVATSSKSIPHIITGDCLGGSIASLFTLWLLCTLDLATAKRPLCITFGSPLIGNSGFQQAISQYSTWNTCFLHVAHKDDIFPKLFQSSTMEQSIYKPFGTFLVCSESGGACFEAPESIIELLAPKSSESAQILNYNSIIKCLERQLICKNHYAFSVHNTDSFKAGITAQVAAIGLMQIQLQNMDMDALLRKVVMSELGVLERKNQVFDPAEDLNAMKVKLANLEWYKKKCEDEGPHSGYYDSFKHKMVPRDHTAVKFIRPLTIYWQRVVEEAEERPQREGAPLRTRWLFGGTNYRRMVEPLLIAEYYKLGKRDYISQGRSEHFKLLEDWLDKHQKQSGKSVSNNSKMKKIMFSVTEDSCFWAHVEEARISCRLLNSGGSNNAETENLVRFEEYVMGLLKNYAVSPDIFLDSSSYMQWWREYEDILGKQMMGASHNSELARFMKDEDYHLYKSGTLVFT